MTDSKMPERIWAWKEEATDRDNRPYTRAKWEDDDSDTAWFAERGIKLVEYIRADLAHPAPAPDAELDALVHRLQQLLDGDPESKIFDIRRDTITEIAAALRARTAQPVGVRVKPFADEIMRRLQRFHDCADDGEGVDIGRNWLDTLTTLGLIERVQRSPARWQLTYAGLSALLPEGGA